MAETTTTATASSPPTESPSADTSGPAKISASQLSEHNKASDCWMAIEGKVYNVTDFVDEHPGGDEIILADAGKDGTEGFNDVGHSEDARKLLEPMYVGDLEGKVQSDGTSETKTGSKPGESSLSLLMFIPVGIFAAYYGYQYYADQQNKR